MLPITLSAVVLLTLAGSVLAVDSPGISRVSAQEKSLVVTVEAPPAGTLRLVELRPYQTYSPDADLPVVWQGEGRGGKGKEEERGGEKGREGEGRGGKGDTIEIPRFDGRRDRLYAKFQLAEAGTRRAVGPAHYVDDLAALPARDFDFPWPKSIKGLQVQDVDDAIALGVKYAGINMMVPSLIDWERQKQRLLHSRESGQKQRLLHSKESDREPQEAWDVDGEKIPINTDYVRQLDAQFKRLTDAGINVTAILLNGVPTQPDPNNPFIHPQTDLANAPFHLGAFNTTNERGLRYYRAALEYLANRYSEPEATHGWVSGYIIGNEVQAHWEWYNIGRMSLEEFVKDYGIALRVADLAVRRFHAQVRTYVSLEHHWNSTHRPDPLLAFRGRDFLEALNAWTRTEGDFPWHVAFHPYPENLFEPRFWNDQQAVLSFDSPKVTFKNVEVLPAFLRQERFLYRGQPRRIILSEQGFHTPDGPDGETIQAAAYACAYYKLRHTSGIDAFILHRHVDHKQEGGLRLGLWTWKEDDPSPCTPDRRKRIYEVFRLADTDQWEAAFEFAKPIIGIKSWDEVLPAQNFLSDFHPQPPGS